ncbi:MFS transporter [Streptomyces sp. NPDC050560]|uniref:MFS transporter n=1 Tax=Streptomyces sp. NPDC050560 TaxID=3365630 RepID=UPI00378D843B
MHHHAQFGQHTAGRGARPRRPRASAVTAAAQTPEELGRTRRAVYGASFGFFVDMFDVYLPTVALVPAMNYFTPDSMPDGTRAILSALIFVATLLGRPVGSVVFGWFADRVGRRRVTLFSVTGCAICTALIALLPGYATLGITSTVLLLVLRLVDGVFMGGEYTGATPLAMEASPQGKRGWYGGVVGAGSAFANCAIAGVTLVVLQFAHEGGPDSAYSTWGWRIPFAVGAVLCAVFLVYYSRSVEESETWRAAPKAKNPLREIVLGRSRRDFAQVFVLMTGVWFASAIASGLLPSALHKEGHISATEVTGALVIAQGVHAVFFPFMGLLSERIGRRTFIAWNGVGVAVVCAGSFAALALGRWSGFGVMLLIAFLVRLTGGSVFSVMPSYLCERFPPATRGSGFGLGYSTPLVITSFYAYYQDWLGHLMPRGYTAVVLLVLGGALISCGALIGPETTHVDLATDDAPADPGTALGSRQVSSPGPLGGPAS